MKAMTVVFWMAVAGVGVSFVGAVVTVAKEKREASVPHPIVTPASAPVGGG